MCPQWVGERQTFSVNFPASICTHMFYMLWFLGEFHYYPWLVDCFILISEDSNQKGGKINRRQLYADLWSITNTGSLLTELFIRTPMSACFSSVPHLVILWQRQLLMRFYQNRPNPTPSLTTLFFTPFVYLFLLLILHAPCVALDNLRAFW